MLVAILLLTVKVAGFGQSAPVDTLRRSISTDTVVIDKIFIIGNKKTKENIIRREMSIHEGDSYVRAGLDEIIIDDRRRIINTKLFLNVNLNIVELSGHKVDIIVRVSERWYFFPVPIFDLADRNFTEWWVNQKHDFSRVNYGLKLRHFNFRGRREILSMTAQFGYTKLFRLSYTFPYINRNQKIGLKIYGDYANNKNIAYKTIRHRLQFMDSEKILRERWRGGASLTYRPNFYSTHSFGIGFSSTTVADTVVYENANYFSGGDINQRYIALTYSFVWDFRDFVSYPLTGAYLKIKANILGVGIFNDVNIFSVNARYSRYFDLGKKFYFGTSLAGYLSTPSAQPYYNYTGVGKSPDFMRGFERYFIEGPVYVVNKNNLKWEMFATEVDISRLIKMKQFSKIPFAAYISLNFEHGYIQNYPAYIENTLFSNRYIYGTGIGLDIVTFYDLVMRWEYSFNIEGENALFFNLHAAF